MSSAHETRLLRRVIHYIWECYRIKNRMKIRLQDYREDELHVDEGISNSVVTVRYFAKQPSGELVKQFESVCFVMRHGEWIPLELEQDGGPRKIYATSSADTGVAEVLNHQGQLQAAGRCDAWAFRLLESGFLATAAIHDPMQKRARIKSQWPEPATPTPDLEQLEEWMWEDGGSEATDGCWLEVDGICPHGHPSWLLRLGLV